MTHLLLLLLLADAGPNLREAAKQLESRDPETRAKAVGALAEIPGAASLGLVLEALRDEDPAVRARARRVVAGRISTEDLQVLERRGLRHPDPRVRLASLRVLAEANVPRIATHLADAMEDRDPRIREAAVGHVVRSLGGRGSEVLAAAVPGRGEGRPRAAALLGLAEVAPERARELARAHAHDAAFEVRVASLEVLAASGAREPLVAALEDGDWSVRLTAIRGLARLASAEAIPPLIGSLRRERGRVRLEAGEALAALTGVGLPPDPDRWERWWREAREGFDLPERPARAAPDDTVAAFHRIPVVSDSIAFVLDRSRSMRDRLPGHEGATKAALVERELEATLGRIEPPARFLLVAFGSEPRVFSERAVKATTCLRHRALEWFSRREPAGRTNLFDSLAIALDRPDVDTVFLLTDGAPSAGEYVTRSEILAEVERRNRFRKAVVHTVEIGRDATGKRWRGFLEALAEGTGGIHVVR